MFARYLDDLEVGDSFTTKGRTITEADIVNFAALTWDTYPLHVDAEWASKTMFGERIAHGMLVLSYAAGLVPMQPGPIVAFYGMEKVRFFAPTKIGDTIRVHVELKEKEERDDNIGLATFHQAVLNQRDETVCKSITKVRAQAASGRVGAWRSPSRAGSRSRCPAAARARRVVLHPMVCALDGLAARVHGDDGREARRRAEVLRLQGRLDQAADPRLPGRAPGSRADHHRHRLPPLRGGRPEAEPGARARAPLPHPYEPRAGDPGAAARAEGDRPERRAGRDHDPPPHGPRLRDLGVHVRDLRARLGRVAGVPLEALCAERLRAQPRAARGRVQGGPVRQPGDRLVRHLRAVLRPVRRRFGAAGLHARPFAGAPVGDPAPEGP